MNVRLLLLAAMGLLLGCPPVLNNPQGADDDDVSDDDDLADDDDMADDDDVADDDDLGDDDDIGVDCEPSDGFMSLFSSLGFDVDGTWYEGDLVFGPDVVEVLGANGETIEFGAAYLTVFGEMLDGPGRVYWLTPGNSPWNQDALLAIEVFAPVWRRMVLSNSAVPNDELSNEFQLWVYTERGGCGDVWETECGLVAGLPLWMESLRFDGQVESVWLQPGSEWQGDTGSMFAHLGGQYFEEAFCPDTPAEEYGWVWNAVLDQPILGIGGP